MPPKNEKRKKPKKIVSEGIYYDKQNNLELWIDIGDEEVYLEMIAYTSSSLPDYEDHFYYLVSQIPIFMDEKAYSKIKSMYTFH